MLLGDLCTYVIINIINITCLFNVVVINSFQN